MIGRNEKTLKAYAPGLDCAAIAEAMLAHPVAGPMLAQCAKPARDPWDGPARMPDGPAPAAPTETNGNARHWNGTPDVWGNGR